MPTAELEALLPSSFRGIPPVPPRRKRWTRDECAVLEAAGAFADQHVELIDGELIDKMGKNGPHILVVELIRQWLFSVFGAGFVLQEAPIDVRAADNRINEPEPDAIALKRHMRTFVESRPGPADLHLVVEVSDSTLYSDLTTKAALYARAGIPEYWVVDIAGRRLVAHREPNGGIYSDVQVHGENEDVAPLSSPMSNLRIGELFDTQ